MSELYGCSDSNCIIIKPEGMATNGGCRCLRELQRSDFETYKKVRMAFDARDNMMKELKARVAELEGLRYGGLGE